MGILKLGAAPSTIPRDDETSCVFVSSHGLLKSCEVRRDPPDAASKRWPRRLLAGHRPGDRVYVHAEALEDFARRALPRLDTPFVLVSGDTTVPVGPLRVPQGVLDAIFGRPHLIRWFAQNAAWAHPKLTALPVGLDYHSLAAGRKRGWGPQASPRAQEEILRLVRRAAPPLADRAVLGFCNWHFASRVGGRAKAVAALPSDAVAYQPAPLPRRESWEESVRHAFVVSPPGGGMDCHRTWEALVLGCIPVLLDLPINVLFRDLPVLIVRDWSEVTPRRLAETYQWVLGSEFDFSPLLLSAWTGRMQGKTPPAMRMSFSEFLETDLGALSALWPDHA